MPEETRAREAIVGGEYGHSEAHYRDRLARSITTCLRLLRPDRWFSVIFQHWDTRYFATILETATACGAELRAAITQTGDVIWSMHKKKHSASVLAGEFMLTFYKPAHAPSPPAEIPASSSSYPEQVLSEVFDTCLSDGQERFTSEALFNRLVLELWRRRALGCLNMDRRLLAEQLERRGWTYNHRTHQWSREVPGATRHREEGLFARLR